VTPRLRERRLSWAELMKRVFAQDVLECPRCKGRMKLIATITNPIVIIAILGCVGLGARPPPLAPARPSPEPELWASGDEDF
jgi:acyl-CoA synthetase (AMP-forming)/AMP-acid ligase II